MADTRKFVDYSGLELFWGKIKDNFARKQDAVKVDSIAVTGTTAGANLTYNAVGSTAPVTVALPVAGATVAGVMTSADWNRLNTVVETVDGLTSEGIENKITVKGVKLYDGASTTGVALVADTDKNLGIKLAYDYNYDNGTAAIKLVDANGGAAISSIDVSALLKTGILAKVELVVNPDGKTAGTYLALTFNTDTATTTTYLNVSDLIDVYSAGEGIIVTDGDVDPENGAQSARTISLDKATDAKLGGIKTGLTNDAAARRYAVKVDADGNAYVDVVWTDATVAKGSTDDYVDVTIGSTTANNVTNYTVGVAAKKSLTDAVALANTSVQSVTNGAGVTVTGGKNAVVALSEATEARLVKADSALQDLTAGDGITLGAKSADNKIAVSVDSTLRSTINTAATTAASAIQTITIGSKSFSKTENSADAATFRSAIGLGDAAVKSVVTTVDAASEALPTSKAVADFVDGKFTEAGIDNKITTAIESAVGALDFEGTAAAGEVVTGVTQVDGKITKLTYGKLSIDQITGWTVVDSTDINAICTF